MELDVLSIAAHPDDTELTCGGTVIKMAAAGYRAGALDLTAGEMGTRGNPELREREASRAERVMGLAHRENLFMPDSGVEHRREYKLKIAERIRALKPRTVILEFESLDKAQAAFASASYRENRKVGDEYAKFRVFAVEGLAQ